MVARPTSDGVVVAPAAAVVETADIGGWRIRATRGPIASSAECESVGAAAGVSAPTMLFAGSGLTLHRRCGSGGGEGEGEVALTFSAEDALSKVGRDSGVAVRAAGAAGWAARRAQYAVHGTRDWTYTTSYGGSVSGMRGSTSTAGRSALYDEAALRDGTRPIRFYADVPLFEDELDDNGVSSYRVRIRCMGDFLFILARFYLRVDGVLHRVRDTRWFHRYATDVVVCERTEGECAWDALPRGVAPTAGGDAIAAALSSAGIGNISTTLYTIGDEKEK